MVPTVSHNVSDDGQVVSIVTEDYTFKVDRNQIQLSLLDANGEQLLSGFASRGIHFKGSNGGKMNVAFCDAENPDNEVGNLIQECEDAEIDPIDPDGLHFLIENEGSYLADLFVYPQKNAVRLSVKPRAVDIGYNDVAVMFSDLPESPIYGFGDYGMLGNQFGKVLDIKGNGHHERFCLHFWHHARKKILVFAQIIRGDETSNQ